MAQWLERHDTGRQTQTHEIMIALRFDRPCRMPYNSSIDIGDAPHRAYLLEQLDSPERRAPARGPAAGQDAMTLDEFFEGYDEARSLFDALRGVVETTGPAEVRVTKSQITFRRRKAFAWVWTPSRYLRGRVAPLVLTLSFRSRDASPRWKQIVEPSPGRFSHHLELYSIADVDDQVSQWLRDAWTAAG
jgi:hypothetical protein